MKKLLSVILLIAICALSAGCLDGGSSSNNGGTDSALPSSSSAQSETGSSAPVAGKLDENGIRALMKENLNCMKNIFMLSSLPTYGPALRDNIYQVDPTVFKDYAEFESYVKSVYIPETADSYLNNYPYEGKQKYLNADGKLCIDMNYSGGKGYYVYWDEYTVEITKSDASVCEFTLVAKIEEPSDNPVKEDYPVKAAAEYVDGRWLLSKMIY